MSRRRSASLRPPQMPCGSRMPSAYSRHSDRTGHWRQIDLAFASRESRSSLRSGVVGGKKSADSGPRHAARSCQARSVIWTVTGPLPVVQCGRRYPPPLHSTRPETRRISAPLRPVPAVPPSTAPPPAPVAVVACPALRGLDLEHEPLDGDDAYRITGVDRGGPVGAGSPPGSLDDHDAVGSDVDLGPTLLADDPFAPDRRG